MKRTLSQLITKAKSSLKLISHQQTTLRKAFATRSKMTSASPSPSVRLPSDEWYANIMNPENVRKIAQDGIVFDPAQWKRFFRQYSNRNSNTFSSGSLKPMRIAILQGTIKACRDLQYTLPDGTVVKLNGEELKNASINSKYYRDNHKFIIMPSDKVFAKTEVRVIEGDCIAAALWLKRTANLKMPPLVLNMASARHPGGGYKSGAGAQEENLHRRTNLYQCLEDPERIDRNRTWRYPLNEFGGIYSPNVTVFRGPEDEGYPFLRTPEKISVLSVAAYAHPELVRDAANHGGQLRLTPEVEAKTIKKIRAMLGIALENGNTSVVLSAFGCGAFANPPRHIAELFQQVLSSPEFHGRFEHVVFAIIDDHNAKKAHNPEGNVAPFGAVFGVRVENLDKLLADEKKQAVAIDGLID
eukprot:GEZU01035771.1.p1 GENE.GEZU01035771.1~~GEZU01035771.1.p1  ORF type:complete len:413 (-),score=88.07 GEZU01035771.1:44-1282(-)